MNRATQPDEAQDSAYAALRRKQWRVFVDAYLACWNASEAARRAGYSTRTAGQQGHRLLKNVEIQAAIQARLEELKLSADEVLLRLAEQARADLGAYLAVSGGELVIDLEGMKRDGKTHLIKKIWQDKDGRLRLELYDAQAALELLGRHHRLFIDGPLGTAEDPIHIKTIEAVKPSEQGDSGSA